MRGAPPKLDERTVAAVDMIGRTGAVSFQIRYTDEELPVAWVALAAFERPHPQRKGKTATVWEVAAGMDPTVAIIRLCEQLIDGGECQHCHRPSVFLADSDPADFAHLGCVYAFDPELKTFRRSCEGDA